MGSCKEFDKVSLKFVIVLLLMARFQGIFARLYSSMGGIGAGSENGASQRNYCPFGVCNCLTGKEIPSENTVPSGSAAA